MPPTHSGAVTNLLNSSPVSRIQEQTFVQQDFYRVSK